MLTTGCLILDASSIERFSMVHRHEVDSSGEWSTYSTAILRSVVGRKFSKAVVDWKTFHLIYLRSMIRQNQPTTVANPSKSNFPKKPSVLSWIISLEFVNNWTLSPNENDRELDRLSFQLIAIKMNVFFFRICSCLIELICPWMIISRKENQDATTG